MSQESEADVAVSWRRRHPVLARSLLYGAGIVLAAVGAALLARRGAVDRQDRLDFVTLRLDGLDLVASSDVSGDEMEKALAEVFAVPDLPAALRQRALRGQSILHLKRGDGDAALADLDAAAGLTASPGELAAIHLERVLTLATDGRLDEAQAALATEASPRQPALAIWRYLVEAQILTTLERRGDAIRALDDGLEALPRPLAAADPILFSLTWWSPAEAALQATLSLADLSVASLGAGPWERLLGLVPRDLPSAVAAAGALQRGGHHVEAARAWAWAVSLNGGWAPQESASDADLAALEEKRVEGLKPGAHGGR